MKQCKKIDKGWLSLFNETEFEPINAFLVEFSKETLNNYGYKCNIISW